MRQAGLDRQESALEVGAENLVPLVRRHVLDLRLRKDAGIGAEDIDAAVPLGRGRGHLFERRESVTSAAKADAPPPIALAEASASPALRATTTTFAPFFAKTPAIPLPIPLLAPVTTTDLPFTDVSI